MVEYIERETLYRRIRAFAADVIFRGCDAMLSAKDTCNPREWTRGYEQGVKDISTLIATQAAADVAPVVRGEWVKTLVSAPDYYGLAFGWKCSACGYSFEDRNKAQKYPKFMKYCPHCGAKMEKEA